MSQGNDFANYGSQNADAASSDGLWYVAVATDDIKTMTLEQLDDAFRLGVITGDTSVWTEGMEAWAPLKVVADLDGSAPDSEESEEASIEDEETHHHHHHHAAAAHASPLHNPFAAPVSLAPSAHASPFGAVVESTGPSSSLSPFGLSTAPVALEVDDEELPMKAARRWHPERWAIGVVALGALGFALVRNDVFASTPATEQQPVAAAAMNTLALNAAKTTAAADEDEDKAKDEEAAPAKAKEEPKAAAADDEPEAEEAKPVTTAALKGSVADALRKKPDSKRDASILKKPAKGSKKVARASKSKSSSSKRASTTMKASTKGGGSAFDPLNGDL